MKKSPIDKFGRLNRGPIGPAGRGFKLNRDGDFDLNKKRLTNVAPPKNENDVVIYSQLAGLLMLIKLMGDNLTTGFKVIEQMNSKIPTYLKALEKGINDENRQLGLAVRAYVQYLRDPNQKVNKDKEAEFLKLSGDSTKTWRDIFPEVSGKK